MVPSISWSSLAVAAAAASAVAVAPAATVSADASRPTTRLVTAAARAGGVSGQAPLISADGRYVAFGSAQPFVPQDTNGDWDVYRRDLRTGRTVWVSAGSRWQAAGGGTEPAMSADGNTVVYATTHIRDTEVAIDLLVRDIRAGVTRRVASDVNAGQVGFDLDLTPAVSGNGRFVAFVSLAADVVPGIPGGARVYRHDLRTRETRLVTVTPEGAPDAGVLPTISADGQRVAFSAAGAEGQDAFVRDLRTGRTWQLAVGAPRDWPERPVISADGGAVAVTRWSRGEETADIGLVVYDVRTGTARRVAGDVQTEPGTTPSLSADGRYVVFRSWSDRLVAGNTNQAPDVFLRDLRSTRITRVSVAADGSQASGPSDGGAITADGRFVAFDSDAANLTPDAPDGDQTDVFVRGPLPAGRH